MSLPSGATAHPPGAGESPVSAIDLWKTAALLLILADHLGLFLFPDETWLRAVGRAGAPVFFFLIGFARTRTVPWFWLAAGLALTLLDWWRLGSLEAVTINILLSFALVRWALPQVERLVGASAIRLVVLVLALVLLIPIADVVIEYGSSGWLMALVGLLHRRALEAGPDSARDPAWLKRRAVGALATLAYAANELYDYEFDVAETWVMAVFVIAVSGLLLWFRPVAARWQPAGLAASSLRWCGRHSLHIYIAQIVGLMALGFALGIEAADAGAEGGEA